MVNETTLSGRAWSANFGWIYFGDGTPANGHACANDSAADYGVNLAGGGQLTGHARTANAGWIHPDPGQSGLWTPIHHHRRH